MLIIDENIYHRNKRIPSYYTMTIYAVGRHLDFRLMLSIAPYLPQRWTGNNANYDMISW